MRYLGGGRGVLMLGDEEGEVPGRREGSVNARRRGRGAGGFLRLGYEKSGICDRLLGLNFKTQ